MVTAIVQALYFFLPAYAANAAPVIFARCGWWKALAIPVDMNKKIGGINVFGKTKTWRGIVSGVAAGILTALLQWLLHEIMDAREYLYLFRYTPFLSIGLGFLMGLGEGVGDLTKSFVKRRLGLKSGAPSFPLDQTSFIGALLLSFIVYTPSSSHIFVIVLISPLIPVVANIIAYKLKLKNVWW